MKKLISILFLFCTVGLFAQTKVKPNYTKPYFQGNVKVKDTLGIDSVVMLNNNVVFKSLSQDSLIFENIGVSKFTTTNFNVSVSSGASFTTTGGSANIGFLADLGDITLGTSGDVKLQNITYPSSDGTPGQALTTNGAGVLSFSTITGQNIGNTDLTVTGIRDLDLDGNDFTITDGAGGSTIGIETEEMSITVASGDFAIDGTGGGGFTAEVDQGIEFTSANGNGLFEASAGTLDLNSDGQLGLNSASDNVDLSAALDVIIQGNAYPNTNGSPGQVITTDGAGTLTFSSPSSTNIYNTNDTLSAPRIVYMDGNSLLFSGSTELMGLGSTATNTRLNIEFPNGSDNPIAFYENRPGGALNGENFDIPFYFNDSNGDKTLGGLITARVNGAPTVGDVNMDMIFNDQLKVQNNYRVLITPTATTDAPVAQFEVRGDAGFSTASTVALFKAKSSTNADIVVWGQNSSGNNLFYVDAAGKWFHNISNLTTADFQMRGLTDNNTFYMDASTDRVGVGTNTPASKLTVASGDVETTDSNSGLVLKDRTNGNRYRVYMDGGVLFTELVP